MTRTVTAPTQTEVLSASAETATLEMVMIAMVHSRRVLKVSDF